VRQQIDLEVGRQRKSEVSGQIAAKVEDVTPMPVRLTTSRGTSSNAFWTRGLHGVSVVGMGKAPNRRPMTTGSIEEALSAH
jgi:hypothetical protein